MQDFADNPDYLSKQLITCIGNKRALLGFVGNAISHVKKRLGKERLGLGDLFSGSGVVSRSMKAHATRLVSNDQERYAEILGQCYLANKKEIDRQEFENTFSAILPEIENDQKGGFISELYAPRNDHDIKAGERVFYTRRNALYLDAACRAIQQQPAWMKPFLMAPLLSEASIHANTSGVFKGFYKNEDGIGSFGGQKGDALERIKGNIQLNMPVWSNYDCRVEVHREDANQLASTLDELDLIYLDPPYNQHPYGSNYFMLNLIADYKRPENISRISGIPEDWNRSSYNSKISACDSLFSLIRSCKASHILVSYNSEGFVPHDEFLSVMNKLGTLIVWDTNYNTFRGSRNLRERALKVKEYLYLLERK